MLKYNDYNKLNEAFFHRSKDELENLIHSFKSLIINLKQSIDKKYTLDFYKNQIKEDLILYKKSVLENYNKSTIGKFKDLFKEFLNNIDDDIIKQMRLGKFANDILKIYSINNSYDINIKNVDSVFKAYLDNVDRYIDNTYDFFYNKIEKDKSYEPYNKIDIKINKVPFDDYQKTKYKYQIELLKLQEWIVYNNKKVLILFEGRDAAGKGSAIRNITRFLDPKHFKVQTFGIPTEEESDNWFDRYEKVLPKNGEIVFFDRSWYTRGYVEPVMGYSTEDKYNKFMKDVNNFEDKLIDDDIILIKIWFSISQDAQKMRFELRKSNPLKYWKFSKNDEQTLDKWDDFTKYINDIFKKTNTKNSPWIIIDADDENYSRLESFNSIIKTIEKNKDNNKDEGGIKIIFEDIDGPLIPYNKESDVNYHNFFNEPDKWSKTAMSNLNTIIEKTDAKVVLSSSYRDDKPKSEIEDMMKKAGFKYKLYDCVPNDKSKKRGADIKDWLKNNKNVSNFIIIDDNKHDLYDVFSKKHIVKTTHELGITDSIMEEAIEKLNVK